ncbi:hypothetical protein C0995_004490 [Termitomyces sp. Mi166|nr:hypothetical protein C0995_004490 [Termitomyces sp. Mi166\
MTAPLTVSALPANAFTPPAPGPVLNGASSTASITLHSRFSNVNTAIIVAIISHEFKAADLHKLNPSNCDKEMAYTFNGTTNQFKISH